MSAKICSVCGGELVYGKVAIRKNVGAKLSWPFPSDRLFFKKDEGEPGTVTVIREGTSYEAYRCTRCEAVVVTLNKANR